MAFSYNDVRCVVTDCNKVKHLGSVINTTDDKSRYFVEYIIKNKKYFETEKDWFNRNDVRIIDNRAMVSAEPDTLCLEYLSTNDGIVYGQIVSSYIELGHLCYDMRYLKVKENGIIELIVDKKVSGFRVIELSRWIKMFPYKVGQKVKFIDEKYGELDAEVIRINDIDDINLEYYLTSIWGDKISRTAIHISNSEIRLIKRNRKTK